MIATPSKPDRAQQPVRLGLERGRAGCRAAGRSRGSTITHGTPARDAGRKRGELLRATSRPCTGGDSSVEIVRAVPRPGKCFTQPASAARGEPARERHAERGRGGSAASRAGRRPRRGRARGRRRRRPPQRLRPSRGPACERLRRCVSTPRRQARGGKPPERCGRRRPPGRRRRARLRRREACRSSQRWTSTPRDARAAPGSPETTRSAAFSRGDEPGERIAAVAARAPARPSAASSACDERCEEHRP